MSVRMKEKQKENNRSRSALIILKIINFDYLFNICPFSERETV